MQIEVLLIVQGTAGAADMAEHLAPAHSDTREQQLSQIPVLAVLSDSERQALADSFKSRKDMSFLQWCMSNAVVIDPASDNVTVAMQSMGLVAD